MKKVFVNGYGSIGSRISQFIAEDSEIDVIGVGKYSPDEKVNLAISRGFSVYVPESKKDSFSNYKISGTIDEAISDCDLVIDASPSGHGFMNKKNLYTPKGVTVIYQGGETVYGEKAVSDLLFNSRANYKQAIGKKHVMLGEILTSLLANISAGSLVKLNKEECWIFFVCLIIADTNSLFE